MRKMKRMTIVIPQCRKYDNYEENEDDHVEENHGNHQKPAPRRELESDTGPEARTTSPGGNPRDSEEDH